MCQACHAWVRRQRKRPHEQQGENLDQRKRERQVCQVEGCDNPMHAKCCTEVFAKVAPYKWMRKEKEGRPTDIPLCNKHYRTVHRQQNEIVCFSCGRKLQRNIHRPINVQALQRGVLTDANQTELGNARICDSCHAKQIKADTSNYTSDAALDKIIAEIKDEISAFNGIWCSDNCVHQAKAVLTAHLAEKLRSNEGTLLSDIFHEFNKILTMHGREVMTKSLYLLTHFEQKLGKHLQVVYVKGARCPGYLLLRSGCDLHHALFCALADKKKGHKHT